MVSDPIDRCKISQFPFSHYFLPPRNIALEPRTGILVHHSKGSNYEPKFRVGKLKIGEVYSRDSLAQQFLITEAKLKNGVFRPKAYSSVWLFVTRNKPAN